MFYAVEERDVLTVTKKQQSILFFIWLVVFPFSCYAAHFYFPTAELDWMNIVLLLIVMFFTLLLPTRLQKVTISLERLVTFTVFFQYGVLAELIFAQIAVVIFLFSDKSSLPSLHKFFVNSTVVAIVSIISGFVFYAVGGTVGSLDFSTVFFAGYLYAFVNTTSNNLLLKIYFYFKSWSYSLYSKSTLWDYFVTILMVSLSLSFYFLDEYIGIFAMFLIGIPFITMLVILRMYNKSNTLHNQLSTAGEISHELAERLVFDEVLEVFLCKLKGIVSYDAAYVVDLREDKKMLPIMGYESEGITKKVKGIHFQDEKKPDDGLSMYKTKVYYNRKEIQQLKHIRFTDPVGTILASPIIRKQKTVGFLILTAQRKRTFNDVNLQIIDVLTGYLSVSLEKARYFEKTLAKSERCGLTNLYNFRYLNKMLDKEIARFHIGEIQSLSILILDIDYFKKINDSYGHESGNDLLVGLARLLEKHIEPHETLARYGGEEFVIVLPDCDSEMARKRAEAIRKEVEQTKFMIRPDLTQNRQVLAVQMTVSIGVTTMPKDGETIQALMRNADRALYVGAKQEGRNKVGIFQN